MRFRNRSQSATAIVFYLLVSAASKELGFLLITVLHLYTDEQLCYPIKVKFFKKSKINNGGKYLYKQQ